MKPSLVLVERTERLRLQLREEETSIQDVANSSSYYAPFADALRSEVLKCLKDVQSLVVAENESDSPAHHNALIDLQRQAKTLFGEAFALKLADSVRQHADNGICRIGDRLLAEFGAAVTLRLPQLTTIAETEFFGIPSRVIRLRYPAHSLWDLPVLAHEFAHSFGPLWTIRSAVPDHPRDRFLLSAGLGSQRVHDEYFCDLLATLLLGPAYVCTCIVDRFTPTLDKDSRTHPSDVKRAWWILKGLDLMAGLIEDPHDRADFQSLPELLRNFWISYLRAAGRKDLDEEETKTLEGAIVDLFACLAQDLVLAPYKSLRVAWGLAADFKEGKKSDCSKVKGSDILNAAWFIRFGCYHDGTKWPNVETWALGLLESLC